MGKTKNLVGFIADKLNDSNLRENSENISLRMIISNTAPKRTSKPLTRLSMKNELSAILELSKSKRVVKKKLSKTKSANITKSITKSKKITKKGS